jgi:predicted metal-dependent hydrolase
MSKIKIDQIIRSARKTLSLEIADDAQLIVRAPFHAKMNVIENVLFKKRLWIRSKQRLIQKRCLEVHSKEFVAGERFLYLGRRYTLQMVQGEAPLHFQERFYLSEKYVPTARQAFIRWYQEQALETILNRVREYAAVAGLKHGSITISNAAKRWGSCSSEGKLRFNWRLVMAPLRVIDYVVVHELVHLQVKNHSRAFWNKVQMMLPNYKKYAAWLKDNHRLLNI